MRRSFSGLKPPHSHKKLAGRRIVARQMIAAPRHDHVLAIDLARPAASNRFGRDSCGHSYCRGVLPRQSRRFEIERRQIRFALMHHGHHHALLRPTPATCPSPTTAYLCRIAPADSIFHFSLPSRSKHASVPLLKYTTTYLPSVTGDGLLPLALRCLPGRSAPKLLPPQFLALHVVAQTTPSWPSIAARDKDAIAPHRRRRTAAARQVGFPGNILRCSKTSPGTRPRRPRPSPAAHATAASSRRAGDSQLKNATTIANATIDRPAHEDSENRATFEFTRLEFNSPSISFFTPRLPEF